MAKRKIEIFQHVDDPKRFHNILKKNPNMLICAEIYNSFVDYCTAMDKIFTNMKLEWSDGNILLLKVMADDIEELKRFHHHSEPVFMFIVNQRVTRVYRGVNSLAFEEIAKEEIHFVKHKMHDFESRDTYAIDEVTPNEHEWFQKLVAEEKRVAGNADKLKSFRQAERKYHRAELMIPFLEHLDFVLFWPHARHAHPELYEKWDENNIIMVGREEIQLTEEQARDILYNGDAPINEASMHALLLAPALIICFRLLDTEKHFVSLVRRILYEDLQEINGQTKGKASIFETAFDHYKTKSLTPQQILQKRQEARDKRKAEALYKRERRLSEMQRLARQAIEDRKKAMKMEREQTKLEHLKAGNIAEYNKMKEDQEIRDEEISIVIPEELPDDFEPLRESSSEDENEYFPPSGLVIPGFYSPPNDIAKVNGLAIVFPKLVHEQVTPEAEFLPPHVLAMVHISKAPKALSALKTHTKRIIHMGIFKATSPYSAKHLANTYADYVKLNNPMESDVKLVFMISMETDYALLALMDVNPEYVSKSSVEGEDDCAAMFPVDYGDDHDEYVDFKQ